jgi:hypothetical protein
MSAPCLQLRFGDHESLLVAFNDDGSLDVRREESGLVLDQHFTPEHIEYPQWLDSYGDELLRFGTEVQNPWTGPWPEPAR